MALSPMEYLNLLLNRLNALEAENARLKKEHEILIEMTVKWMEARQSSPSSQKVDPSASSSPEAVKQEPIGP